MLSGQILGYSKKIQLLEVLLNNIGRGKTVNQLAELSFSSEETVRNYLKDFQEENILIIETNNLGKKNKFSLNLRDDRIKALCSFYRKNSIN